jgi:hypothetical protein
MNDGAARPVVALRTSPVNIWGFCLWNLRERFVDELVISPYTEKNNMSVEGKIKEGAGYVKEEMNEHKKDPKSQQKAQEGRDLRNEGRIEDGKAPKTAKPGSGH